MYTLVRSIPQGRAGETEMAVTGIRLRPESPHKKLRPMSLPNSTSPQCPKHHIRSPPRLPLPRSQPAFSNPCATCSAPPRAQLLSKPSL